MRANTWQRIEYLFLQAVELPLAERSRFLDAACPDARLRADVESLLAKDDEGDEKISFALAQEAALLLKAPTLEGERLGVYRVLHEIGRGGMGAVYLAVRDDDQYQKQVAIKIVKRGMDTSDVLRRFRHERQILAGLEHPYIAGLLDGGCTRDGRPFLVMELVEGQPIDSYCKQRQLNLQERLQLFLKVCEAVSYAHRKLVVHRDLKPANILITGAASGHPGCPKLLDFGLAKILDPGQTGMDSTSMPMGPLTPEYASPEQLAGASLTTATDIYSLGVILHELLTGVRLHRVDSSPITEWTRIVRETEVVKPSSVMGGQPDASRLRRHLQGDLDNIVLLAMRKEPERRYASVDEFAADIRSYLASRPVRARHDSMLYRTRKFVRRRRYPLLAAACVLLSLIGGMVAAVVQAREAEAARRVAVARQHDAQQASRVAHDEHRRAQSERDAAVAARLVAEDRLTKMVDLSDRSLSDVYDLMERLAGGMPARKEMIATSLAFLEGISKDAGSDPRLHLALAKAYRRLGDIQNDPSSKSRGWSDALKSYRAAAASLEAVPDMSLTDNEYLRTWLEVQDKAGMVLLSMGRFTESRDQLRHALSVVANAEQRGGATRDLMHAEGNLYTSLSKAIHPDLSGSRPISEKSVRILAQLVRQNPTDCELRYDLSRAYTERGYLDLNLTGPESALADYERTIDLREQVVKERPNDAVYRRTLVLAYVHMGHVQSILGKPDLWRSWYEKGLQLAAASANDPQNLLAAIDYAQVLIEFADGQSAENASQAMADRQRGLALLENVVSFGAKVAEPLALAHDSVGFGLLEQKKYDEAIPHFRRALQVGDAFLAEQPSHRDTVRRTLSAIRGIVESLTMSGDREGALAEAAKLMPRIRQAEAAGISKSEVEFQSAEAEMTQARVYFAFRDWQAARAAAQNAIDHAMNALSGRTGDPALETLRGARELVVECNRKLSAN